MNHIELELTLRASGPALVADLELTPPDANSRTRLASTVELAIDEGRLRQHALTPAAYGQELTSQLFRDPRILVAWARTIGYLEGTNLPLRLRLRIGPGAEHLHGLRWELLRDPLPKLPDDPSAPSFICHSQRILFSRYLDVDGIAAFPTPALADLRALVAVAGPSNLKQFGLAPVDVDGEVARARAALSDLSLDLLAGPAYGGRASLSRLLDGLRQGCDLLYLVCHGTLADGGPLLWLEQEDGKAHSVGAEALIKRISDLSPAERPRLVVLAVCESAGTGEQSASTLERAALLAALAPRLIRAGVGAVIGMQGNLTMEMGRKLMPRLFDMLRADGQIDRALAIARADLPADASWWMPALYMRARDGRLWSPPPQPVAQPAPLGPQSEEARQQEQAAAAAALSSLGQRLISGRGAFEDARTRLLPQLRERYQRALDADQIARLDGWFSPDLRPHTAAIEQIRDAARRGAELSPQLREDLAVHIAWMLYYPRWSQHAAQIQKYLYGQVGLLAEHLPDELRAQLGRSLPGFNDRSINLPPPRPSTEHDPVFPQADEHGFYQRFRDGQKSGLLAIVGPPGSGKTSLLRLTERLLITNLQEPNSFQFLVDLSAKGLATLDDLRPRLLDRYLELLRDWYPDAVESLQVTIDEQQLQLLLTQISDDSAQAPSIDHLRRINPLLSAAGVNNLIISIDDVPPSIKVALLQLQLLATLKAGQRLFLCCAFDAPDAETARQLAADDQVVTLVWSPEALEAVLRELLELDTYSAIHDILGAREHVLQHSHTPGDLQRWLAHCKAFFRESVPRTPESWHTCAATIDLPGEVG